jgi:LPS-assembly lipoprotein
MCRGGSSTSLSRRGLLGLGATALLLGGCGFRPMYAPGGAGAASGDSALASELAAVRVALIPERFGQLLRRGLQQRLGTGAGAETAAARYELRVAPSIAGEGIGFDRTGASSRVRMVATGSWALVRLGVPVEQVATGAARVIDAFNVPPNQFFASDASREAAERRLSEMLSAEIVERLAAELRRRQVASAG